MAAFPHHVLARYGKLNLNLSRSGKIEGEARALRATFMDGRTHFAGIHACGNDTRAQRPRWLA